MCLFFLFISVLTFPIFSNYKLIYDPDIQNMNWDLTIIIKKKIEEWGLQKKKKSFNGGIKRDI